MSKRKNISSKAIFALSAVLALQLAGCGSSESRAQGYYDDGMKLLGEKNYQVASVEFRNAVKAKKDMLPAWRGLAQTEEALHHWDVLASALRTILELDPKDDVTRLQLAKLMLAGGAPDQALKLANDVSDPNATNASLLALKGAIYLKLKDEDTATLDAQAALKIEPKNTDALLILASERLANNDPQGALQFLPDDADNPNDVRISLLKMESFQKLKDYPKLEATLKSLIERFPQNSTFRKQLAALYVFQHRPDDAEQQLRELVSADAGNSQDGLDLIKFILATKGPDAARHELETRISAGGKVLPYQLALAELDFGQGKADDAFTSLKKLADSPDNQDSAKAKVLMAQLTLRQKNPDGAEKIVNEILQKDTRNDDALKLRALIRMDRGQLDDAIGDLRSALSDQPRSTDLMIMLADAYERSGSTELADKQYTEAEKSSNFDPRIGLLYVEFLQRHGNNDRAFDFLAELANRQPNSVPVLSALGDARLRKQDWAGAEETAERIKRLGNNEAVADQIQGAALTGEHKYDAGIAAFQNAVAAAPTAERPMAALVNAMVAAKKTDQAVTFLKTVLKDSPSNADAYVLLGNVQLLNNQPDQALASFNSAIDKQPKNDLGYRALVDFYVRQNKPDLALDAVQSGLKVIPDDSLLQMTKAGLLERAGNFDAAIAQYQDMLKRQPGSPIIANNLASLLADHRTDKDSLDQARDLIPILKSLAVPQFKDTIGWVTYRLGNSKAAVPLLEDAAAGMPKNPLIHYHLGMSYIGAGEPNKAADQLKEALNEQPAGDLQVKIKESLKTVSTQ